MRDSPKTIFFVFSIHLKIMIRSKFNRGRRKEICQNFRLWFPIKEWVEVTKISKFSRPVCVELEYGTFLFGSFWIRDERSSNFKETLRGALNSWNLIKITSSDSYRVKKNGIIGDFGGSFRREKWELGLSRDIYIGGVLKILQPV